MSLWELQAVESEKKELLEKSKKAYQALLQRKDLGFWQLADRSALWTSSEQRAREVRRTCPTLVILGMGGSSLGGRALWQALRREGAPQELIFIDNIDSDNFWKVLRSRTNLDNCHWVIVSKSGTTLETLTMTEFIDQHLRASGFKKLSAQCTVISETDDNPLLRWAQKENVPYLEIPKDVGGRFSVLCPVGLMPAAFIGADLEKMQKGMKWALAQEELIARLTAQTLMSFDEHKWITLFWAYSDSLREFGLWIQQLWAESLGKKVDRAGKPAPRVSTPMSAIGSSDQHSILQQVMEGTPDKFIWFLRVLKAESSGPVLEKNLFDGQGLMKGKTMGQLFSAMADATRDALKSVGVTSLTLQTEQLDEESLGALFMLFELVVGTLGEALNINAFDQPGVELGKRLAKGILNQG